MASAFIVSKKGEVDREGCLGKWRRGVRLITDVMKLKASSLFCLDYGVGRSPLLCSPSSSTCPLKLPCREGGRLGARLAAGDDQPPFLELSAVVQTSTGQVCCQPVH